MGLMVAKPICLIGIGLLLCACSHVQQQNDPTIARISIQDKPNAWKSLYRYVVWAGEDYGPNAFVTVAKQQGVRKIILESPGIEQENCAIALGAAVGVPVFTTGQSGLSQQLQLNTAVSLNSCALALDIPHPALSGGEHYVVIANRQVALEGEKPMSFEDMPQHLKDIGAKAIVLRQATIGDLLCLSAIAAKAGVKLGEVQSDGSVNMVTISGSPDSVSQACSQE